MWFNKDYLELPENPVTRAYLYKSLTGEGSLDYLRGEEEKDVN